MSTSHDILSAVAGELAIFFEPLAEATTDATGVFTLLSRMGWTLDALIGADVTDVSTDIEALATAFEQLAARELKTLDDAADLIKALLAQLDRMDRIGRAISKVARVQLDPEVARALVDDLFTYLFVRYLERRSLPALQLAVLLTLIEPEDGALLREDGATGPPIRLPKRRAALRLDNIPRLLSDPIGHLSSTYVPVGGIDTQEAAERLARTLFGRIRNVILAFGGRAMVGLDGSPLTGAPEEREFLRSMTAAFGGLPVFNEASGTVHARAFSGVTATIVPAELEGAPGVQGPGLSLSPFGVASATVPIGAWDLAVDVEGQPGALFVTRDGVAVSDLGAGIVARGEFRRSPETSGPVVFGSTEGTRLEIGQPGLALHTRFTQTDNDFGIVANADKAALIIAAGDGDGFLQQILPKAGLHVAFDMGLGWSRARGLTFRGSAGLDATFAVNKEIAGVLRIEQAHVELRALATSVRARVAVSFTVQLGPVKAAVERLGLTTTFDFVRGEHVSPLDVEFGFLPPRGAALAINAGVVTGGGYLAFDTEKEQYTGAVMLEIAKILNVTAFGLLTTRMPDGSPGFSLLVLISAQFTPPLQLGFGFTLNGIGGLVGVNRTVAVETLRGGLKSGSMGRILFPDDPIRHAPQIVSELQSIFPPAPGRFLFGPMIRLGWGTPTLLTLDLGVILELPAPVRLVILGRMRLLLPEQRAPIVRLQLDVLGVIDFESGDIAVDAALYDSRVATFAITGDMALRANFGSRPAFVLAVGGFHPRFSPPEGFPALDRVAISLAAGNNPRLRLDAYLALTTNTVQFGAHLDLYVGFAGFSIEGYLGFDTLIQFAPFGLVVDVRAGVAVKFGGVSLLAIALELTLSGPSPWRARGKATFTIVLFKVSASFDLRFGRAESPALPPPTDVLPMLLAALADDGNWAAPLPPGTHPVVSLRQQGATRTSLFVHPLGIVQVRQRVVPLEREIARFGNSDVDGARTFVISVVDAGHLPSSWESGIELESDMFAPSQFYAMTDDEKLTAPAFELMPSGIRFGRAGFVVGEPVAERMVQYETTTRYGSFPVVASSTSRARPTSSSTAAPASPSSLGGARTPPHLGRALPDSLLERTASAGRLGRSRRNDGAPTTYTTRELGVRMHRPKGLQERWRSRPPRQTEWER